MGIRDEINRRPYLAAGIGVAVIGVSLVVSLLRWGRGGRPAEPQVQTKAFYTVDDGATLFEDAVNRVPPFDYERKVAIRAYVFSCDGGRHQWVQYVEKFNDRAKRQMEGTEPIDTGPGPMAGILVKKPSTTKWIGRDDPHAQEIMNPKCPDGMGSGPPQQVFP